MANEELEKRIVDLETKASFQEATIADMNKMIIAQGTRIEKLEATLRARRDKVKDMSGEEQLPEHERPPHY